MFGKCRFLWGRLAVRYWATTSRNPSSPQRQGESHWCIAPACVGTGIWSCWCRCLAFWAQVWKRGCDLRQQNALEAISRRRSPAENHTCARKHRHLRQKSSLPAPQTATTCARIIHHLHHLPPASRGVDCRLSWSMRPNGSELVDAAKWERTGRSRRKGARGKVLGEKVLGEKVLGKKGTRREWMFPESYPRKPTRDSSTKSRVEGRTMRRSA